MEAGAACRRRYELPVTDLSAARLAPPELMDPTRERDTFHVHLQYPELQDGSPRHGRSGDRILEYTPVYTGIGGSCARRAP